LHIVKEKVPWRGVQEYGRSIHLPAGVLHQAAAALQGFHLSGLRVESYKAIRIDEHVIRHDDHLALLEEDRLSPSASNQTQRLRYSNLIYIKMEDLLISKDERHALMKWIRGDTYVAFYSGIESKLDEWTLRKASTQSILPLSKRGYRILFLASVWNTSNEIVLNTYLKKLVTTDSVVDYNSDSLVVRIKE